MSKSRITRRKIIWIVIALAIVLLGITFLDGFSFQTSPFALSGKPVVAMRIVGNSGDARVFIDDPNTIRGYSILQQRIVDDAALQKEIIDILNSKVIYGGNGARCFEPGIAIRFGEGKDSVDALICLDCGWIYFFKDGDTGRRVLNFIGKDRIKAIYSQLFPGHSIEGDEDEVKRTRAYRHDEADRRFLGQISTTQASTQP